MSESPSVVSIWRAQVVVGAIAVLSCMAVAASLVSGWPLLAVLFLPLMATSVLLLLTYGPIRADADSLWMDGSLESVGMRWDEIRQIRFGRFQLVLEGEGKRLVLPKTCFWSGPGSTKVHGYLKMLSRDYLTPPPPSRTADLVLSRNVVRIAPPTLK